MTRAWRWTTASGLAVSFLLVVGFTEEITPKVVLPRIDVTAPAEKLEAWRYAEVANWEVYSQVSDTRARSMLQSLRKFDFALRIIQPRLVSGPESALTVILVDEARFRTLAGAAAASDAPEFSALINRSGKSAIVINAEAEFGVDDSTVAVNTGAESEIGDTATESNTVDPHRQLDRQYVRHVLAAQRARLPAWLEEGMAQALTDMEYRGAWINYGKVDTEKNMPSRDQPLPKAIRDLLAPESTIAGVSFKQVFAHRRLMPLEDFFAARRADGSAPSPDSVWAKQAYAFVHFCLFGNKLRYQEPMGKLATRLASEPMSEKLFKECFGVGYAKLEKELSGYIDYTRHSYQRYPLKPDQRFNPGPIEFRQATRAEIDRLKRLES